MLKKLIYRSHYRGTKEGDYLLSSFAKNMLKNCTEEGLKLYNELVNHNDTEIHLWVLFPTKGPAHLQKILIKIADFHKLYEKKPN